MYSFEAEARISGLPCDVSEFTGDDRSNGRFAGELDRKRRRQCDRSSRILHEEPIRSMRLQLRAAGRQPFSGWSLADLPGNKVEARTSPSNEAGALEAAPSGQCIADVIRCNRTDCPRVSRLRRASQLHDLGESFFAARQLTPRELIGSR